MLKRLKNIIYTFDLIGPTPQLLIFNKKRFQSIPSFFISIIIIIISLIFAIISIIEYLKYENPIISFTKANDEETRREIFIKDTPLLLSLVDAQNFSLGGYYFEGNYDIIYDNGTFFKDSLIIERCQIGKNIDIKDKTFWTEKYKFGRQLNEFYCISFKNNNFSLFYHPNIAYSYISIHTVIKKNSNLIPENLQTLIISESSLISHNDKYKPLSKNYIYQFTTGYNSFEFSTINFNFQYIKYEIDDGLFFRNNKLLHGKSFSDMTNSRKKVDSYNLEENYKKYNSSRIGTIIFSINKSNYDNYNRSYPKLQSLLADAMSVVSLLFEIGSQISYILLNKKMSKDIIQNLIDSDNKYLSNQRRYKLDNLFKKNSIKNDLSSSERNKIKSETKNKIIDKINEEKNNNNEIQINITKDQNLMIKKDKINQKNLDNKILDQINYFHIIKSYFCFKDEKIEAINLCDNIINEDLSVNTILKRLYNLEKILRKFINIRVKGIKNHSYKANKIKKRNFDLKDKINKIDFAALEKKY